MTVTRFAPSPTGFLHLGHAFAALMAQRSGTRFLLRIEDLDAARSRPEFTSAIFEDLSWLGLSWETPLLFQSARGAAYGAALEILGARGLTYPCFCTRAEIAAEISRAGDAPPYVAVGGPDGHLYPGTCRHLSEDERAARKDQSFALRLDAARAAELVGPLSFLEHDAEIAVDPLLFGDIVLARKGLPAAYHLAVVVDDAFQGVDLVTRGEDLLPATHVQRLLQALLDLPEPAYAHHRLILDSSGRKFSKRDNAATLAAMRRAGVTPAEVKSLLEL